MVLATKDSDGLYIINTALDDSVSQCHAYVSDGIKELGKTAGKMFGDLQISIDVYILSHCCFKKKKIPTWLK